MTAREQAIDTARFYASREPWLGERVACESALEWFPCGLSTDQLRALAFGATFHGFGKVIRHCGDCGNPDCPKVSSDPYWSRCPATDRLAPEVGS